MFLYLRSITVDELLVFLKFMNALPSVFSRFLSSFSQRIVRPLLGLFLGLAIALFGLTSASFAVSTPLVQAVPAEAGQSLIEGADIAAEKIDQFAQAYLQVLQLLGDREAEISAAETTDEALKIEQSIESDAVRIIQDSGLFMPEYMKILGLASQDAAFQDKVLGRMDESGEM